LSIRVIVADDHPVVRDGLRTALERDGTDIVVVGEASDGMEVLSIARTTPADVFILDITMPNMNGIEAARELRREHPAAKILMLSLHDTYVMVEEAFEAGARGYLVKETATRHVAEAVTQVHMGHRRYLSPEVVRFAVDGLVGAKRSGLRGTANVALTRREREVLQLIAEGHSNKEIAAKLKVSFNTVHAHRNSVMAKLSIHKQAHLVRYAIKEGIAKL